MATRHVDHGTGLVYHEQQFRPQVSHAGWDKKPIKPPPRRRRAFNRSLMDMAMATICDNINLLSAQDFQCCPELLVWRLWDRYCGTSGLSFHGWKIFLEALAGQKHPKTNADPWDGCLYPETIAEPKGPLVVFLDPLRSPRTTFLVVLTISHGASFEKSEMLALAGLENLCILSIISPGNRTDASTFPRVDDRLVREWSLLAHPFPSLQVLRIWGKGFVTIRSLEHILAFPRLKTYSIAGSHTDWRSRNLDEKYQSRWTRVKYEDPEKFIKAEFDKIKISKPCVCMHLGEVPYSGRLGYEVCYTYIRNEHAPELHVGGSSKTSKRPIGSVSKPAAAPKGKRRLNTDITQVLAQFSNS
ncbi:hypothetical protein PG989_014802 [Apiospora arundinis]